LLLFFPSTSFAALFLLCLFVFSFIFSLNFYYIWFDSTEEKNISLVSSHSLSFPFCYFLEEKKLKKVRKQFLLFWWRKRSKSWLWRKCCLD
jgi:hypothetical protein